MGIRRSTLIGTAVAMALFGRDGSAQAQEGTPAASGGGNEELQEVVVTGIRASLRESLETKRESSTIVDALTAEDVGKFPDKNLAEALQRVPGIVINREFGEGERINLRGTGSTLTRTTLNGHSLATADWFILDQLQTTRSFNYLMLPADIIGKVTVFKAAQADVEEGGIGGVVDVVTRNPLDLPPFAATASLQGAYSELADKTDPQASALLSWRDPTSSFGIVVAGIYQKHNIRRDGVEVLGYGPVSATDSTLAPSLIGSALFEQERVRQGGNIGLQFKPTDKISINLTGLFSEFKANNTNANFLAWGSRALGGEAGGTPGALTNATIVGDTAVAGTISSPDGGTTGRGVVYDVFHRFATSRSSDVDLDALIQPMEDWTLHFKVGTTSGIGNTNSQPFVEFGAPARFSYDLRGRSPQVTFIPNDNGAAVDPVDPTTIGFDFSANAQILNDDSENYAYADFEKKIEGGLLESVKFGAKRTDHDRKLTHNATTYGAFHVPLNTITPSQFAGGTTPGDFLENISASGTLAQYWTVDQNFVDDTLFGRLKGSGRVLYPPNSFAVNEKTTGGYVMGNLKADRWRGNVGVRFVRTEQKTSGNIIPGAGPGVITNPFTTFLPTTVDRDYNDVLPSLNIAYNLQDDVILRFAAARVMARPDYTDVVPRTTLNAGAGTGQAGNPDVDPYRANQADLSLEWYRGRDAAIAVAVYYKDIKSFITDSPVDRIFPVQTGTPRAGCTPTAIADVFDCPFVINERANGGGGSLTGAELAITQPIAHGVGVQANYSYSDADTDSGDPLPGNSKNTYNAAVYYEDPRWSARLAYTFRDDFFVTFDRSTQLNQKAIESLDASLAFNVTPHVALNFDAVNLTDDKIEQFAGEEFRPRAIYDNGRVYYAGVRVRF